MERNGIDLDLWEGVKDAVQKDPEEARVIVRTTHRWVGGFGIEGHATEIESGEEITPRSFEFKTDWPTDVGGADAGPSPGEALLGALGGCIGLSYVANAVNRGIEIDQLEIEIEAKADLQSVFEAGNSHPGLSTVAITVRVRADADEQTLIDLGRAATRTSTVFNSLAHPVSIVLNVEDVS